jgi:leucyl-tRNA synthetase
VWRWQARFNGAEAQDVENMSQQASALRKKTHQTIAKITSDFELLHLNTSVAALMELFNGLNDFNVDPERASTSDAFVAREALEALVVMLAPFAPHVAEEMWEGLGHTGGLLSTIRRWPIADPELARKEELEIPIQVNGKLRSRVIAAPDISDEELRSAALANERVKGLVDGHEIVKVVVVSKRLVNIVIGN